MAHAALAPIRAAVSPSAGKTSSRSWRPSSSVSRPMLLTLWSRWKPRKCRLTIRASSFAVVDGNAVAAGLERCFLVDSPGFDATSLAAASWDYGPVMMGGYGAFGAVTLEKPNLEVEQKTTTKSSPELDTGGRGGNIGKGVNNGGGGGDGVDDDDTYFDNFDEGDDGEEGGIFRRRIILPELFDRKFVEAVLNEWHKTMLDLPTGFRQMIEMGLVSSAQLVKFLAVTAWPNTERFVARSLPQGLSRAFICRMIADPAFFYKFLFEQLTTIGCSVWWEMKNRKQRITQEWQLALANVMTAAACNGAIFWLLAPCHSCDLQTTLQKLPENIFEKSYPLREFDFQKRLKSFFLKGGELWLVGVTAGMVQGAISNFAASKTEGRLSVTLPSVSGNAFHYGAFLGLFANLQYQLLCGFDKAMTNYFDVTGVALVFSTAMRVVNIPLGQTARLAWLGVTPDPLAHPDDPLNAAYIRPSEGATTTTQSSSKWFISKNAITSGLGLLGFKQQSDDTNTVDTPASPPPPPPKTRRKRVVRRKVASS